jgi:hypothetical protein
MARLGSARLGSSGHRLGRHLDHTPNFCSKQNPRFTGVLGGEEADDGTRTHDLLHGKGCEAFAPIRFRAKPRSLIIQHVSGFRVGAVTKVLAFSRMRDPEDRASPDRPNTDPSSPAANHAMDQHGLTVIRRYDPVDDLDERLARASSHATHRATCQARSGVGPSGTHPTSPLIEQGSRCGCPVPAPLLRALASERGRSCGPRPHLVRAPARCSTSCTPSSSRSPRRSRGAPQGRDNQR